MIVMGISGFIIGVFTSVYYSEDSESTLNQDQTANTDNCNVSAFSIKGYLDTYTIPVPAGSTDTEASETTDVSSSEDIVAGIQVAEDDPSVTAILVSIDSGGGSGVAGEEIANALKRVSKPNIAVIRSIGASAAYWAATGADKIYASRHI